MEDKKMELFELMLNYERKEAIYAHRGLDKIAHDCNKISEGVFACLETLGWDHEYIEWSNGK